MITEQYLLDVMEGRLYCPRSTEIRLAPCPRPPTKSVLLDKLLDIAEAKRFGEHGVSRSRAPNKEWLLNVLSTLKLEDEVFSKDYLPPRVIKKAEALKSIPISSVFFQDLPPSKSRSRRCRLKIVS